MTKNGPYFIKKIVDIHFEAQTIADSMATLPTPAVFMEDSTVGTQLGNGYTHDNINVLWQIEYVNTWAEMTWPIPSFFDYEAEDNLEQPGDWVANLQSVTDSSGFIRWG